MVLCILLLTTCPVSVRDPLATLSPARAVCSLLSFMLCLPSPYGCAVRLPRCWPTCLERVWAGSWRARPRDPLRSLRSRHVPLHREHPRDVLAHLAELIGLGHLSGRTLQPQRELLSPQRQQLLLQLGR